MIFRCMGNIISQANSVNESLAAAWIYWDGASSKGSSPLENYL